MIDRICTYLTNQIRKEMPDIDDERAEIIMYGLQNIIGELPKGIIILFSRMLKLFKSVVFILIFVAFATKIS